MVNHPFPNNSLWVENNNNKPVLFGSSSQNIECFCSVSNQKAPFFFIGWNLISVHFPEVVVAATASSSPALLRNHVVLLSRVDVHCDFVRHHNSDHFILFMYIHENVHRRFFANMAKQQGLAVNRSTLYPVSRFLLLVVYTTRTIMA